MSAQFRTALRWALGLTFLIAGGAKILEPSEFFSGLLSYHVPLPEVFWRVTAAGLPWFEILVGLGFVFNFWPETIRPTACLLSLIFIVMLSQALIRGLDLDCNCFGGRGHAWFDRPEIALIRSSLLFGASLYLAAPPTIPLSARKVGNS